MTRPAEATDQVAVPSAASSTPQSSLAGRILREDEWLNPDLARQRAQARAAASTDGEIT